MKIPFPGTFLIGAALLFAPLASVVPGMAQSPMTLGTDDRADPTHAAPLAVAEEALAAITRGEWAAVAELMTPEAWAMSVRDSTRYSISTPDDLRTRGGSGLVERGFNPIVHVSGALAVVWLPYDLYRNGEWSHCGVDSFTLVRTGAEWKIANLSWTMQQPPECDPHPDGPPR